MSNCLWFRKDEERKIRRQSLKDRKQSLEQRISLIEQILEEKHKRVTKLLDERALDVAAMIREGSEILKKMTRLKELEEELVEVIKEQEAMDE